MTMFGGVRFDPDDLPRFAGDLFDRARSGGAVPDSGDPEFGSVVAVLSGSGGGSVDTDVFDPAELLGYVLGVVRAESGLPASALAEPVDAHERRARVEEAVRRIVGYRS